MNIITSLKVARGDFPLKAGLLPGDQFDSMEGKEMMTLKDTHDAVVPKGDRKDIPMTLLKV